MTPAPRPYRILLILALTWACTPHRPWDRSVPAAARTRWRLGQDIFSSVRGDVKLMDPAALTQDPAVRRAAEAALLSFTAHVRLPADPARTRRLLGQLEKAGFGFAAARLRTPVKPFEADERFRLATRDWSGLDLPLTPARVEKADAPTLRRLVRTHLHDPSGAVAIWALELSRRGETSGDGLDCAAWQTVALSSVESHSERVLRQLWPAVRNACTGEELEAWVVALDGRLPELLRLFGAVAGFEGQVRVCVLTGARFPAAGLREAFGQLADPGPTELALGLLCSDEGFLSSPLTDPVLEALRLHWSGRSQDALAGLRDLTPAPDPVSRLRAGLLALGFGDRDAAAGHFRWAAATAGEPARRREAYGFLRIVARFTAEEEWTALTEQFRLDPLGTARELWLSGQWPALVLLAGRAPVPWSDEAGRALAGYAACHPDGGALTVHWRALMGEENLKKVWPAPDPERTCRPPGPLGLEPRDPDPEPAARPWEGDFHSDLAILLHEARPPADWEAFLLRHGGHPQVTTAAELARDLHPDSPGHLQAAAAAFWRRNDPDRAADLLRAALALRPDRAAALAGQAGLLLQAGYRHEAAALWRERFAWQTAFLSPEETGPGGLARGAPSGARRLSLAGGVPRRGQQAARAPARSGQAGRSPAPVPRGHAGSPPVSGLRHARAGPARHGQSPPSAAPGRRPPRLGASAGPCALPVGGPAARRSGGRLARLRLAEPRGRLPRRPGAGRGSPRPGEAALAADAPGPGPGDRHGGPPGGRTAGEARRPVARPRRVRGVALRRGHPDA
jgi:hypothetical protein